MLRQRRAGHAARAVLRPRLRAGHHPVHGADGGQPDLDGPRPRDPRARDAVVGLGRLRLAHQRDRPRGGRRPPRDVRRDGGAARHVAGRARRVRRPRAHLRRRVRVFRGCWLVLFFIASADTPMLRHSIWIGLVPSTAVGVGLLVGRVVPRRQRPARAVGVALAIDMLGPFLFGSEGWKLEPHHFAERHGLIFIIALGESIVAIGVGSEAGVDAGVITAAVLGVALAATMWWAYFDVVAIVAARRLAEKPVGREQNEMARDSYSFLHFPMVAGVVLIALGLKKTIAHVDEPLSPRRRSRWSAAWRSTCSPTSPSGWRNVALDQQAAPAWSRSCWSRSSPSPTSPTPLATLAVVTAGDGRADRLRGHPLRRGPGPDPPPGSRGVARWPHRQFAG